jgi:hypothetical protein
VATAAHGNADTVPLGKLHRALDVGNAGTARNQGWATIDIPVPDAPGRFVTRVPTLHQLAAKALPKIFDVHGV